MQNLRIFALLISSGLLSCYDASVRLKTTDAGQIDRLVIKGKPEARAAVRQAMTADARMDLTGAALRAEEREAALREVRAGRAEPGTIYIDTALARRWTQLYGGR